MKLRGSHFIWCIKDGMVKKVYNMDSYGRPGLVFKKLEDIIQATDAEDTFVDDYDGAEYVGNKAHDKQTCMPLADSKTRARDTCIVKDDEPKCPSDANGSEEMTLAQLKKKYRAKKRKASESVLLTPKAEDDDSDLGEPLCKWRVKVSKSSMSKMMPVKGSDPTSSRSTLSATSEPITSTDDALLSNRDLSATVTVKAETPQLESFECRDMTHMADVSLICNEPAGFSASISGVEPVNHDLKSRKSGSFTNEEEICSVSEASLDNLDYIKSTSLVWPMGVENMELPNEENMSKSLLLFPVSEADNAEYVNHPPSIVSSSEVVSPAEDRTVNTYNSSQSHPYLQQIPEQVNHISGVQDSDSTIDNGHCCVDLGQVSDSCMVEDYTEGMPKSQEDGFPSLIPSYLCLPWKSHSWSSPDDDDMISVEVKSPSPEEKQPLALLNADAPTDSLNSDNNSVVFEDVSIHKVELPFVPVNADSEVKFSDHNYQTDITSEGPEMRAFHCTELRHSERLPSARTAISPTSQEKLCLAMNSAELLDDMDHFKCKEKLYFGEQAENKSSPNRSEVDDNETNVDPQQATWFIQNKVATSPKKILNKPKNFSKDSPPKRCLPPKGCLDGPRLCRSLPRLSTGCTSIQGCSENAIAFSQRQMHDIESLALKLINELNSMKVVAEEKLLYEANRSTSLKNEAAEVKSAIKTATKTEKTARKWLSMMARDCNRFCKIMQLNQDDNAVSADPTSGGRIHQNSLQKERKKISFADESGGKLCDVKVLENEVASLESMEKQESSLA